MECHVTIEGSSYALHDGESVLECLERHGVAMSSSCRSGVCQSCMLRCVGGEVPLAATKPLRATLREQGYFLSCVCRPTTDLSVTRAEDAIQRVSCTIAELTWLNQSILCVRLSPRESFLYSPGQFANFVRPDGTVRSYSIASLPEVESTLEFHVASMPNGKMSGWLANEARVGDALELTGPNGNCFYTRENLEQPILLVGTGTGLAPLYGIVRDALQKGHTGPIHLFHGSLFERGLYLVSELRAMAESYGTFQFTPCVLNADGRTDETISVGAIDGLVSSAYPSLKGWRVYLCGHPDTVKLLQRKVFLAGASMKDILADAFLPSATGAAPAQ